MWGVYQDHINCGDTIDIWQVRNGGAKCLRCLGGSRTTRICLTQIASCVTALNVPLTSCFSYDSAIIHLFILFSAFLLLEICWPPFGCLDRASISAFLNFGPKGSMKHPRGIAKNSDSWSLLKTAESASRSPGEAYTVSNLLYLLAHLARPYIADNIKVFL